MKKIVPIVLVILALLALTVVAALLISAEYKQKQAEYERTRCVYVKLKQPNPERIEAISAYFAKYVTDDDLRIIGRPIKEMASQEIVETIIKKYHKELSFAALKEDDNYNFGNDEVYKANYQFNKTLKEIQMNLDTILNQFEENEK